MELSRPQKIAYSVVAVLVAIFLGVLVYSQLWGGRVPAAPERPLAVRGLKSGVVAQPFDVRVLSDERYQSLDHSLFDAGRVPVPVPAARGKPNLF